ncbi:MAG TPA: peptidoglycan DD-metalloendopeptidase family protein [Oligoflexus sp.]|uniref:peptidoglycan DD-metalloendopeptidase family protein n=1 Tax=Oligoflexus sp. TaxID=1971216 RepID=UPI002D7343BD|nr:peptidoglycan DD-metalloendopeptidase family protein [Oligoflexus sp.]HYX35752.1 peptidoglycan DD-metalloendopeptidase family protein [Oligoflexus sp.]
MTDSGGSIKVSYRTGPWGDIGDQSGNSLNRMIFTSQEHDPNAGLVYFGARYYEPGLGRFVSKDPLFMEAPGKCLKSPVECNMWGYVMARPTNSRDYSGYVTWPISGGDFEPTPYYGNKFSGDFGPRIGRAHRGFDIRAGVGTDVLAFDKGSVKKMATHGGYGRVLVLEHKDCKARTYYSLYAHLSAYKVTYSSKITNGMPVASSGRDGISDQNIISHLHFEIRLNPTIPEGNGSVVSPLHFYAEQLNHERQQLQKIKDILRSIRAGNKAIANITDKYNLPSSEREIYEKIASENKAIRDMVMDNPYYLNMKETGATLSDRIKWLNNEIMTVNSSWHRRTSERVYLDAIDRNSGNLVDDEFSKTWID